jgi:hypothetical protein
MSMGREVLRLIHSTETEPEQYGIDMRVRNFNAV